ncbi:MAG: hypothetical protein AAFR84_05585 [Pseudomonadota bacterium]
MVVRGGFVSLTPPFLLAVVTLRQSLVCAATLTRLSMGFQHSGGVEATGYGGQKAMRNVLVASAMALGLGLSATASDAATIDVFGTGLDGSGALLPTGASDANWTVTAGPLGALTPEVINDGAFPFPPWEPNTPNSQWVGPPTPDDGADAPPGDYTYQTTFNLSAGADLSSASIVGQFAADDTGTLLLNGNVVATTAATFGFRDFTDFTIDTPSFFTAGTNVLEVVLTNFDSGINPTGIQVLITDTFVEITEVPVPAGILLLLSALGVAGITLRKRADA